MQTIKRSGHVLFLAGFSLMGLAACSDEALQSALYNPYPDGRQEEITTVPSTTPVAQQEETQSAPSIPNNEAEPERVRPNVQADPSARPYRPWALRNVEAQELLGTLFDFLTEDDIETLKERIKLRVELVSVGIDEYAGERYLDGILSVDVKNDDGIVHRKIMNNVGKVIFRNEGTDDWMIAEFRISSELSIVLDLVRNAATTPEEALSNPWAGTLAIKDKSDSEGIAPAIVAEISGFVAPLSIED